MRNLTSLLLVTLVLIIGSGCSTISKNTTGENFFPSEGDMFSKEMQIEKTLRHSLGKTESYILDKMGKPLINRYYPSFKISGWMLQVQKSHSHNFGIYQFSSGVIEYIFVTTTFNNNSNLVSDYELVVVSMPYKSSSWTSKPIIQVILFEFALKKLEDTITNAANRSLDRFREKTTADLSQIISKEDNKTLKDIKNTLGERIN